MLAARAALTSVFSKTSKICFGSPTPPLAITGMSTASLMVLFNSIGTVKEYLKENNVAVRL